MRDVSYPRLALYLLLGSLGIGLLWGLTTSGVAYGPYNYDWNGGSDLRETAGTGDTDVRIALSTGEYQSVPPDESVAFVIQPRDRYGDSERAALASFVSQGGTLVVAAEANETNLMLADLGTTIRVDGTQVRDEQNNVGSPAFPRATDVSNHSYVRDVDALTLNHGTVLDAGEATPLANTSGLAYLDRNENEELDANESLETRPVAAVEQVGAGEIVVVSDPSVFTNAMLEEEGNDQFVRNVATDRRYVLLDYSQQGSLPPLSYAFLVLRDSPLVQLVTGLVGLGAVTLWGRTTFQRRLATALERVRGESASDASTLETVETATLATYIGERHPDWNEERVERVTKAIIRQQRKESGNE